MTGNKRPAAVFIRFLTATITQFIFIDIFHFSHLTFQQTQTTFKAQYEGISNRFSVYKKIKGSTFLPQSQVMELGKTDRFLTFIYIPAFSGGDIFLQACRAGRRSEFFRHFCQIVPIYISVAVQIGSALFQVKIVVVAELF